MLVLRLRPLAFVTFLVWWLGICACGFWRLRQLPVPTGIFDGGECAVVGRGRQSIGRSEIRFFMAPVDGGTSGTPLSRDQPLRPSKDPY